MPLLEAWDLTKRFGGVVAVTGVSLHVNDGDIVGLIGPNGSGKTTLLRMIMGLERPDRGGLRFNGERLDGSRPHTIVRMGIGMTHQLSRVFPRMTVLQNMMVASREGLGPEPLRRALELLEFFRLQHLKDEPAAGLSYGQQKLLELARVLMLAPRLILLDEPVAGVNPAVIETMLGYIRALHEQGKTFVVVEHQMAVISTLCNRVVVLDHGEKIAEGTPEEVRRDKRVIEAYLGG